MYGQRDAPRHIARNIRAKVIRPDTRSVADDISREFNTRKLASMLGRRDFGLVDGNDHAKHAHAETRDDPADTHGLVRPSDGLNRTADAECDGSDQDRRPSTACVGEVCGEE